MLNKYKHTAMAIAICASVTVSIGDDMRGAFNVIFFVKADVKSWKSMAMSGETLAKQQHNTDHTEISILTLDVLMPVPTQKF